MSRYSAQKQFWKAKQGKQGNSNTQGDLFKKLQVTVLNVISLKSSCNIITSPETVKDSFFLNFFFTACSRVGAETEWIGKQEAAGWCGQIQQRHPGTAPPSCLSKWRSSQIIWHPELCFRFPVYQGCVSAVPNTSGSFLRANNATFDLLNCIRSFHLLMSVSMITNLKKLIQTPSQFSPVKKNKTIRTLCLHLFLWSLWIKRQCKCEFE